MLDKSWNPTQDALKWSQEQFNTQALKHFVRQFERNAPYRQFCIRRAKTPETVSNYLEIPAVPTDVFKHIRLTVAEEPQDIAHIFRTSGTTMGRRGEHHFTTEQLDLYRQTLQAPFRRFALPDWAERDKLRMLCLAPSSPDLPDSSLSFMLSELVATWGDERSAFFVHALGNPRADEVPLQDSHASPGPVKSAPPRLEFDVESLRQALRDAESEGVPTMVLGTAFAFVEFFDATSETFGLAPGSRAMETGGLKGRTREVTRSELYQLMSQRLGLPRSMCISEYSMTELTSQAYSDEIWRSLHAHPLGQRTATEKLVARPSSAGSSHGDSPLHFYTPPWARVDIVDPLTLEPVETPGQLGLIRWTDLANVDSVMAVQTADLGREVREDRIDEDYRSGEGNRLGGFTLEGRAQGSALRGCSLTMEEIIASSAPNSRGVEPF